MKIVQHCNYIGKAKDSMGSERVIEALTKSLILQGHEVVMLVNPESKDMPAPIVTSIPDGFDIVHAHGGDPELLNSFGVPWVSSVHGGGSDAPGAHWHNNPHYICVSDFICKLSNNSAYVHSCVDPDDFIYKSQKEDYFAWIAGTDWENGKGLFTAIQLAKKMRFRLKIAGIGKNMEIIAQIKKMCDDKIEYVGAVNGREKAEFLANAKALLFYTRLPDACPLTIAESLISGTPIIGSVNGSLPELIPNECGILCQNEQELPKAILNISKIKPINCYNYALDHFSSDIASRKYLQLYRNMLEFGTVNG